MDLESLRKILMAKPSASEDYPFGPDALVIKVGGKVFAIVGIDADPLTMSLKCDPDEALALRAEYRSIQPGYHQNKRHWNTVTLDGTVPQALVLEMIDGSYKLVVEGLSKAERDKIGG
jgi:predicted DNA-binding protein (MmcQ/YjbR family)